MQTSIKKCVYPNNILVVSNDGNTISCPLESGNVKLADINNGIKNAWQSPLYDDFRNNLDKYLNDKNKICWQCNLLERNGATSLRTELLPITEDVKLKGVQFKLSNKCQLVCAHCGPLLSSSWGKHLGITKPIRNFDLKDNIIEELKELVPSLNFIRFTGGEPWIDPTHWKILNELHKIDKKDCELHYITNGLGKIKKELWEPYKRVLIMLSVDGYAESYEWFRRKSSWKDLIKNYENLKKLQNVEVWINFSITPWTINYLDDCKNFFSERFFTVPIMNPSHCSLASISKENYEKLGLTNYPKYSKIIGSNIKPLEHLKNWALKWDRSWNTIGQAEKIHPWLLKI